MIENNELLNLEQQLENQLIIVKEMRGMKREMTDMRDEIKQDVEELRDSITLTRSEGSEIQKIVGQKSWRLADELFVTSVSDDLFLAKVGHFRGIIYKKLKETFNIPRYYDLRRIDFKHGVTLVENISLSGLSNSEKKMTEKCKRAAEINGDNITRYNISWVYQS